MNRQDDNSKMRHIDFLLLDSLSLLVSFVLSYLIKFGDLGFIHSETWMPLLYIVLLLDIVICLFSDPYSGIFQRAYYDEIIGTVLLTVYNLSSTGILLYVLKVSVAFSRQMILTMYMLYFVISLAAKCLWKKLALSPKTKIYIHQKQSLFIVADSDNIENVFSDSVKGDFTYYDVKGIHLTDCCNISEKNGVCVIGDDYIKYIVDNHIEEVLFASKNFSPDSGICKTLVALGIGVHFLLDDILGFNAENHEITNVGVNKTLCVGLYSFTEAQTLYFFLKRFLDIIIGAIGCAFLIPAALLIKVIYLLSGDCAPVIFTQNRVGKNGKQIKIYKFRTMVPDAEKLLLSMLEDKKLKEEWEENQKFLNDPRITKIGKFLRKTSVDELPQFINVLKGEMSLVGPRPLVKGELEAHNGMKLYEQVKPGITGWWGCNGRSNINYHERLELEYYYVKNISFYLDFLCILRTALSVLQRDGAQ